ncbi:hypothetical protein BASA61_001541 [Batrachochytrium salamandrivorans]|nr:hypothetical protein BASA61_001541 [Batrachochytrium salamandrivorans]
MIPGVRRAVIRANQQQHKKDQQPQQRHQQQQQQQQPVSWPASQARRYYSQSATPNEQDSDSDDFVSETDSLLHTTHPHQDNYSKDSGRRDDEPTWREHLAYTLDSSHLARWWDIIDAVFNAAFVAVYITMTTYTSGTRGQEPPPAPPPQSLEDVDFVIALLLFFQWAPRVYISVDPVKHLTSVLTVFSIVTTLPVIWAFILQEKYQNSFLEGGVFVFLYPLRFWRLHISIGKCLRPGKNVLFRISPIVQKALNLGLSIFNTLFTVTAWVHICLYIVQRYYDLSFFDVFYTIAVSSTSGLSTNIVPDNFFSRLITLYVMIVGAIFIPTTLSDLIMLIRSQSKFDKRYTQASNQNHVLLVGNFDVANLRDFFREFFCEDHGYKTMNTQIVMLNPSEPGEDLQALLTDPIYSSRIQYVKGSTMSFHSLHKVSAELAEAAFILSSRNRDTDPVEEDAKSVMRALSIRRFYGNLKIFAQILLPGNKTHLTHLADHTLCIDEFMMGMLAQNSLAPGFSTFMYLITTSIPDRAIRNLNLTHQPPWVKEYFEGASMELYAVKLSHLCYAGVKFSKAVIQMYREHQTVMFALGFDAKDEEEDETIGSQPPQSGFNPSHRIVFNPLNYILNGGETAYLLTTHSRIATKIASEGLAWTSCEAADDNTTFDLNEALRAAGCQGGSSGSSVPFVHNKVISDPNLSPDEVDMWVRGYVQELVRIREADAASAALYSGPHSPVPFPNNGTPVAYGKEKTSDLQFSPSPIRHSSLSSSRSSIGSVDMLGGSSGSLNDGELRSSKRRVKATDELIVIGGSNQRNYSRVDVEEEAPTAEQVMNNTSVAALVAPTEVDKCIVGPEIDEIIGFDESEDSHTPVNQSPLPVARSSKEKKRSIFSGLFSGPASGQPEAMSDTPLPPIEPVGGDKGSHSSVDETPSTLGSATPKASVFANIGAPVTPEVVSTYPAQTSMLSHTPLQSQPGQPSSEKVAVEPGTVPNSLTGHLLLCSLAESFPKNLAYFVAPFRHKDHTCPIVLLCAEPPAAEEWVRLSAFGNIYYLVGTPLLRRDLRKVFVQHASRAIVLVNPRQQSLMDRSADAPALLALLNIQAMCAVTSTIPDTEGGVGRLGQSSLRYSVSDLLATPMSVYQSGALQSEALPSSQNSQTPPAHTQQFGPPQSSPPRKIFIMVEFVHRENMKFVGASNSRATSHEVSRLGLSSGSGINDIHGQNMIPAFVGGHVFSQSLFHSILCQTYYNEYLLRVLKMFLFNGTTGVVKMPLHGSAGGPGVGMGRSATDRESLEELGFTEDQINMQTGDHHGNFYQVAMPADGRFSGLAYGAFFGYMVSRYGAVPLALYRRTVDRQRQSTSGKYGHVHSQNSGASTAQVVKYVVVNPAPGTILHRDDCVFFLASKRPIW